MTGFTVSQSSGEPLSTTIVRAVAECEGCEQTDLPPLYETIDPDAVDSIFAADEAGGGPQARLAFTYEGYRIVADSSGEVTVEEGAKDRATEYDG